MATPAFENESNGKHPQDWDDGFPDREAIFAAIRRDPEAAALAIIEAVDRFLSSGCPLHPEPLRCEAGAPVEGTLSAGINCPLCNSSY